MLYDLRQNMFNHLQGLSLSYFAARQLVGSCRASLPIRNASLIWSLGVWLIQLGLMNILTSMVFYVYHQLANGPVVLLILPVLFYVAYQFRKRILGEFRNVRRYNSRITGAYNENITAFE